MPNYLRIPFSSFFSPGVVDDWNVCLINVQDLNQTLVESNDIILGSMLFEQFFGVFTNTYELGELVQNATIYPSNYAGYNSVYVGNETLPLGTNPFVPAPSPSPTPTPSTPSSSSSLGGGWIALIVILVLAIVAGAAFLGYKMMKDRRKRSASYVIHNSATINDTEAQSFL